MGVSKNRGRFFSPKMDGENSGKPELKMDDLGVPLFLETPNSPQEESEKKHNGGGTSKYTP